MKIQKEQKIDLQIEREKINEMEVHHLDMQLKIVVSSRTRCRSYDVYMNNQLKWKCVPSLKQLKKKLNKLQ